MRRARSPRYSFGLFTLAVAGCFVVLAALLPTAAVNAEVSAPSPATSSGFADIRGDEWYAAAAYALADRAAMLRHWDGSFDPDGFVTRAQMAYFLTRAMGLAESPGQPFSDVDAHDWFEGSVGALFQKKLMQGTGLLEFLPERVVSKQEAVTLVMNAMALARGNEAASAVGLRLADEQVQLWLGGFRDRLLIAPVHAAAVASAYRLKILDAPTEGWFFPADNLTRAEMAVVLSRAFLQPIVVRTQYPEELPAAPEYSSLSVGSKGTLVSFVEARLAALHYPCGPVDGVYDNQTRDAVTAFQKVERLRRTGKVNAQVWKTFASASIPVPSRSGIGDRCEVDLTRQVLFMISDGEVAKVIHVSTGKLGTRTGHFSIKEKYEGWVDCVTLDGEMYYPSYVVSKTAIHGYRSVPAYPASHGCVRVPVWTAEDLFNELPSGTVVDIFY